ncbi:MAG TPA: hypothetical protein DCQ64_01635, partial [Candidatus Rokubacteria bacterium]|nr:hypothetical protein [Candidatus Rokubacteria bacterium]
MISGMRAYDPVESAIRSSPYFTGLANREAMAEAAEDLNEFYQGNHMPRVHSWIDLLVKRPEIRARYHEAAVA